MRVDKKELKRQADVLIRENKHRPVPGVSGWDVDFKHTGAGGPSHDDPFVYMIGPIRGGPFKVGFAKNVVKRLATLQIGSPVRLRTWCAWRCPQNTAREVERRVHKRLDWARIYGEWFDIDHHALYQVIEQTRAQVLLANGVTEVNGSCMQAKLDKLEGFDVVPVARVGE